jgi:hypothetical protein
MSAKCYFHRRHPGAIPFGAIFFLAPVAFTQQPLNAMQELPALTTPRMSLWDYERNFFASALARGLRYGDSAAQPIPDAGTVRSRHAGQSAGAAGTARRFVSAIC